MERYESLSTQLKECKKGTSTPFITLDDPGTEQSLETIDTLIKAGADALELGVPFSDPLAGGPTTQNATLCAFAAEVTPMQHFEMLTLIRQKYPAIPISLLIYANLVFNKDIDEFYVKCGKVGVDSVLVADMLVEKSAPSRQVTLRHNVAPIFICPSNADDDLPCQIAPYGRGYTYLLSRVGMTDVENRAALPLNHLVAKLKEYNAAPLLQGFSIPASDQVEAATNAGAMGAISGSVTVKTIERHINEPEKILAALKALIQPMKAVTRS